MSVAANAGEIEGAADAGPALTPLSVAALRAHPGFERAMIVAANGIIAGFDGNPLVNRVMNDRGRSLFAVGALYLDATPDAFGRRLTPARMIDLATSMGLGSAGRAKAMLALLRWGGYLVPAQSEDPSRSTGAGDRRERPLAPTEKLRAVVRERWRTFFVALALIRPEGAAALAGLSDAGFERAFVAELGSAFRAGFRPLDRAPLLGPVSERDAGLVVMLVLVVASHEGGPPPPIARIASRFGVSRAHILDVLREAEAGGLIRRDGARSTPVVTPVLRESVEDLIAGVLAMALAAGTAALAQTGKA